MSGIASPVTSTGSSNRTNTYTQEWLANHAENLAASDKESASQAAEVGFAARLYSLCLAAFQIIDAKLRSVLNEELGALYLWGEAFGAGELDKALNHSDDVRNEVLDSLGEIGQLLLRELLQSHSSALKSHSTWEREQIEELKYLVDRVKDVINIREEELASQLGEEETDSDSVPDSERFTNNNEKQKVAEDLEFHIGCLKDLGPTLERNLIHAEKAQLQSSRPPPVAFTLSDPASYYVAIVREKFCKADARLVERLGEANWQRHNALREQLKDTDGAAVSSFRPISDFYDSGLGSSVPTEMHRAMSHTSFQSSISETGRSSLRVPATPAEVTEGITFRCKFCRRVLSKIRNRIDWKMHVFEDLRPYICTFTGCSMELAQFTSRSAWAEHEFSEHRVRKTWNCPECPISCSSLFEWESHLDNIHHRKFIAPHSEVAAHMACEVRARPIESESCPLCKVVLGKPRQAFVKHVGRHMEEIALVALPRDDTEDSGDDSPPPSPQHGAYTPASTHRDSPVMYHDHWEPPNLQRSLTGSSVPAEPFSFQYRRDSQGQLYQVPYIPPSLRASPSNRSSPPEPFRAPPIVQEVITHYRHIDHGFERSPDPESPTRPRVLQSSLVNDRPSQGLHGPSGAAETSTPSRIALTPESFELGRPLRLSHEQVAQLEKEFMQQSKPNIENQTGLAESMGVERHQINTWFQNRRAKAKRQNPPEPKYDGPGNETAQPLQADLSNSDHSGRHHEFVQCAEPADHLLRWSSETRPGPLPSIHSLTGESHSPILGPPPPYKYPWMENTPTPDSSLHHPRYPNSLFSSDDKSERFAEWLFEPDTVKGFKASQDTAGGRSESRENRGPETDYLDETPTVKDSRPQDISQERPHLLTKIPPYSEAAPEGHSIAALDPNERRGSPSAIRRCHSCNRADTSQWRSGPDDAETLCNTCGLEYAKLKRKIDSKIPEYPLAPAAPLTGLTAAKRRGRAAPPGRCYSCNRADTPEWRTGPDGPKTLCNACGLHYAKLTRKMGSNLPKKEPPS